MRAVPSSNDPYRRSWTIGPAPTARAISSLSCFTVHSSSLPPTTRRKLGGFVGVSFEMTSRSLSARASVMLKLREKHMNGHCLARFCSIGP